MEVDPDQHPDEVQVDIELTGPYDAVVGKLHESAPGSRDLDPVVGDFGELLETITDIGGGTRSAIADELPADMAVSYDPQAVVDVLAVLERYDLVRLEGNTWKPGPALHADKE